MLRQHQREFDNIISGIVAGSGIRTIYCSVCPGGGKSILPIIAASRLIKAGWQVDSAKGLIRFITPRVSGGAVCRPLDPLVMRFINKEELMTGNEDLTVQFGEDPPWDDLPPVDREKANKELESRLIFDSWTCRFCGGTFADRTRAIKHAIDCDDNEDVHSCATCASYEIGEDTRDGYRHICKGNPKRIDTWMKHCPEWIGA
ncbi:MAG: hypothetical protein PHH57_08880 [Candidatus Omnitrophica bacterium]|nr:hypothetical protein [Candidatus Omnitrophota bacterium]